MSFYLKRNSVIYFNFWLLGIRFTYSTKIKIDRSEWDLKTQRPKARRGQIGEANRKITHELNEYQKVFDDMRRYYKESLTKEIVRKKFDEHFQLAQVTKRLNYSDYFQIYIQQKKDSESVKKDSWQKYTRIHTAILQIQKKKKKVFYLSDFDSAFFNDLIAYFRKEKTFQTIHLEEK